MFERAIEKARTAFGGGSLVRLNLEAPAPAPRPAPAPTKAEVVSEGQGIARWYIPDVNDRWLYRSGLPADPVLILRYIQLAEQSGETCWLFALYEEMYARDAHIRSEVGKASSYVLAARRDILPMPATYRKPSQAATVEGVLAHEITTFIENQVYAPGVDFEGAIAWLCSADLFGIAVLEVETEWVNGQERLLALRRVPPQRLRLAGTSWEVRGTGDEWIPLAYLQAIGAAIVLEYESNLVSPARRGLYRSILPLWLMRTEGPGWWGRAVEIFGMPMRVATTKGGDSAAKQDLGITFEDQGSGAFFSLPEGTDVKLLDSAKGDLPHERFLEWAAKEISKAIHHSTQHSDIQKDAGSVASSQTHLEVMLVAAQERANRVGLAMTEQLFGGLVARNFGYDVARTYTPELRFRMRGGQTATDALAWAQALDLMQKAGMQLSPSWAYDLFSAPVPDPDEEPLEPVAPAPPTNVLPFPMPGQDPNAPPTEKQVAAARQVLEASRSASTRSAHAALSDVEKKAADEAWKAGRDLLAPYVELLDRAGAEGWPLPQLMARVLHTFYGQPGAGAATLRDTLAAVIADAELRGIGEIRKSRGGT